MDRPNFICILMDDMGYKDLGCYGSSFYETPNLDAFAAGGVRFTDAYASCPVCSPTRASWMTGRYPARVGLTNYIGGNERGRVIGAPYTKYLPLTEKTVARSLKDAGYQTWHVGKWHLGPEDYWPEKHGFDVNVAGCRWGCPANGYFSPWGNPRLEDGPDGEYLTDRMTEEAIRLIEGAGDQPFYLNLCYYAVHTPIQSKAEHVERFAAKAKSLGLDAAKTFEEGEHFRCEHKRDQRVVRRLIQSDPAYAAMMWSVDENIGKLLAALAASGKAGNTVIFYTSDNGGLATAEGSPTCNAPLAEGKGWMYEGGTREVLLARAPGVTTAGETCDVPVTSTDFYPTMLELAGLPAEPEHHCDGVSMVPLLNGAGRLEREAIFWHYPHYGNQGGTPGCSLRAGDHKLIEFLEDGRLELYNLREDPSEDRNLADETPELAGELHAKLVAWREDVGATIPKPNPEWTA